MAAVQATVSKYMSLADGTLRIQVDIHQRDTRQALELLAEVGRVVAIAGLTESLETLAYLFTEEDKLQDDTPKYLENEGDNQAGKLMQALYRGGWFHAPKVLEALGKDAEFLQFTRAQGVCWCCSAFEDEGASIVAAHYRKVSSGAGTGVKPPYSAIPLCSRCHDKQHQHGYAVLGTNDWWEAKVAEMRQRWGHERMRAIFETESMTAIPAKWIVEWALEHELNAHIPKEFLA